MVYATTGATDAGSHGFTWDGKDRQGNTLPEGAYTIAVNAANDQGEEMMVETFVSGPVNSGHEACWRGPLSGSDALGLVNSVRNDGDGVVLMLDDVSIPATSVRKVSEPGLDALQDLIG